MSNNISTDNLPTYSWYKDNDIATINGIFTSTMTTISKDNFTSSELANLPALNNFNLTSKKIISFGLTPLKINAITDQDKEIKGILTPNSSVLIEYNNETHQAIADSSGFFSHEMSSTLPIGTKIKFTAKEYDIVIYTTKTVEIIYPGDLTLDSATKTISFSLNPISLNPIICPKESEIEIKITDTRVNNTPWNLYAQIDDDLTSSADYTLPQALIFIDKNNIKHYLSDTKTLIYSNKSSTTPKITTVTMSPSEGLLLELRTYIVNNNTYKTNLIWFIAEENA